MAPDSGVEKGKHYAKHSVLATKPLQHSRLDDFQHIMKYSYIHAYTHLLANI